MIPAFQRKDHKKFTHKRYNTIASSKSLPNVFKMKINTSKSLAHPKIYQDPSIHLLWLGFISAFLSLVVISLIAYEVELFYEKTYITTSDDNILRAVIFLLCIFHALILTKTHLLLNSSSRHLSTSFKQLFSNNSRLIPFIADLWICLIHTPPGLSVKYTFYQLGRNTTLSYNDLIFLFALLKLKFVLILIAQHSKYNDKRSQFFLSLCKGKNHMGFILKAFVSEKPFMVIYSLLGFIILILGLLLRDFEKSVTSASIWDELWLGFLTITTIGYGDSMPQTHIGRLILGLAAILGIFVFSYNVMAVRDLVQLSSEELEICKRIRYQSKVYTKLMPIAAKFIQQWWRSRHRAVKMIFALNESTKRFRFLRLCLISDLSVAFDVQLKDSGKIISKHLEGLFTAMSDCNKVSTISHKFARASFSNVKALKKLNGVYEGFSSDVTPRKSSKLLYAGSTNIVKLRSKAVKNMFMRRACAASILNVSPSLSYMEIE